MAEVWPSLVMDAARWGEWGLHNDHFGAGLFLKPDGTLGCQGDSWDGNAQAIRKIGKKKAGRLLDGPGWNYHR